MLMTGGYAYSWCFFYSIDNIIVPMWNSPSESYVMYQFMILV